MRSTTWIAGCLLAGVLSGGGSPALSAPSHLWSVPLPPQVRVPSIVSAVLPMPHDVVAVTLAYPDIPGSGQVWWLSLRTGLWNSGPVGGVGTLINTPSGVVLAGNLDGAPTISDIGTGRRWWVGSEQLLQRIVGAAAVQQGAVAVAVAGEAAGEILVVGPGGVLHRVATPGIPTALASWAGQIWWATVNPNRLWSWKGGRLQEWSLAGPITHLAAGPGGVAGLIRQLRDPIGLSSLVAWVRAGGFLSYVGIAAAQDATAGSVPLSGGPVGAVSLGPPADGSSWIMLYNPDQHQGWLASLNLTTGAISPAMSGIPAAVPSTFLPDFPVAVSSGYVVVGMGAGLVIRESTSATSRDPTP